MNQAQEITNPMSAGERRASFSLAAIFGLRMLGLFMILPVLSLFAEEFADNTPLLTGFAISAYGLTQALFQIPFGLLSDRYGRKRIITIGLLIFALGSVVAALSTSIYGIIAGRALQGCGAIAAAVMALAADLTREVHRTKAMAVIGISIGFSFAVAMVLGPLIASQVGISGLFWVTGLFALLGIGVLWGLVPTPVTGHFHRDAEPIPAQFKTVLADGQLLRLDFGILTLHLILTASFVVLPLALRNSGLAAANHWQIYLPVLLISMAGVIPFIIIAEKWRKMKPIFLGAIVLIALADLGLFGAQQSLTELARFGINPQLAAIGGFLLLFFLGFNLLEATLPSMISKLAPVDLKGTAMGIYSTSQFLGAFVGGIAGGWIYGRWGTNAVFLFCSGVALLWLLVALSMKPPRHLSSQLFNVGTLSLSQAKLMSTELITVRGVIDAVVVADEGVAYLKVDRDQLDQPALFELIEPEAESA